MPESNPKRIMHLITTLDTGGAEVMLAKLVGAMDRNRFQNMVVSMVRPGPVAASITGAGIPLQSLGLERGRPTARSVASLIGMIRRFRPHVVQTWLYHADLLGLLAARACSRARVAWNIRCSFIDLAQCGRMTAATVKCCAWLSSRPDAVIANSLEGMAFHRAMGYHPRRFDVIPNGFDLRRFSFQPQAGAAVRNELGIAPLAPVVAMIARFDPIKDHATFLGAFARASDKIPGLQAILCGDGVDPGNASLYGMVRDAGLDGKVRLLGRRQDIAAILSASSVLAVSSRGEGFPNVVGEAMACQIPVVGTDVGDIREIVGDAGLVAPPGDPQALGRALEKMLALPLESRMEMGAKARQRVRELFSMERVVGLYEELYAGLTA